LLHRSDLSSNVETAKPDWEIYCNSIAKSILKQQDPEMLLEVRGKLYQLMSHCM
jgi:replication factor C subunit 3/5